MSEIIEELRNVAALEDAAFGGDGPVSVIESAQEQDAADAYRQAAYNLGHADLLRAVEQLQAATPAPLADAELAELAGLDFSELRVSATTCQNMQDAGQRTVKVDVKDLTRHLTRALTISAALPGLLARLAAAETKVAAAKELIDARQEDARIEANNYPSSAAERASADARYMELALVALAIEGGQPHA